jgi:hypothetical protein
MKKSKELGLTGEQVDFINQTFHQGAISGGWTMNLHNPDKLALGIAPSGGSPDKLTERRPCIKFCSDGKIYAMSHTIHQEAYIPGSGLPIPIDKIDVIAIADITNLKGESFSNGFASHDVPIKLVMTDIEPGAIKAMNIPASIRSESAPELCIFHETHSAIGQKALQDQLKAPSLSLPDFESSKTSTKNLEREVQELQQRLKEELKSPEVRQDRQRSHSILDLHSKPKPQARRGSDSTYNR